MLALALGPNNYDLELRDMVTMKVTGRIKFEATVH